MSLIPKKRDNNSRYTVNVVDPNNKKIDSFTSPFSRGKRATRNLFKKITGVLMILVFACTALLGTISLAAPAQAGNFIEDGFKSAFCGTGLFGYELEQRYLGPTTGDNTSPKPTPYEKYGTAGLSWTVWLGPESQEGLDGKGNFGGKTIVDFAGGEKNNGGVDKWGDSVASAPKNEATSALPGFYNTKQTCAPIMEVGGTTVANLLLATTGEVVFITNTVYQVAYETGSNILTNLAPTIKTVVSALKDAIYFEFLTVMIMLAALWMAWIGLVKKASVQMAQGAIWMIGAAVASVALMTNPLWLPTNVNTVVSSVSEAGMNAVTTATAGKGSTNICAVSPDAATPTTANGSNGNTYVAPKSTTTRNIVRQTQCTIWYSFLYTPWAIGEFGDSPANLSKDGSTQKASFLAAQGPDGKVGGNATLKDPGVFNVKMGNTVVDPSAQNWALFHLDNKVMQPNSDHGQQVNQQRALLNVASAQLHNDNPNLTYKGNGSAGRIASASLTLIAAIGAAIMIVIISMSMIVLDVGLVILTLVAPIFFLAGVHPGFGRKVALGWLESIAGLAIKRIVLSLVLSVMLVFYATILASNSNMPWIVSMILIIAVSIGGITYKDQIVGMFNKISFGGDGGLQAQSLPGKSGMMHGGKKLLGAAIGAGVGGAVARKVGGAGPRKASGGGAGVPKAPSQKSKDKAAAAAELGGSGAGPTPNKGGTDPKPKDTDIPKPNDSENNGSGAGEAPRPNPDVEAEAQKEADRSKDNGSGAGEQPRRSEAEAQEIEAAAQAEADRFKYDESGNERSASAVAAMRMKEQKPSKHEVAAANVKRPIPLNAPRSDRYSRAYEKNKVTMKKREMVTGPAKEIRNMISGADKAAGSPMKNTGKGLASAAAPVTKRISNTAYRAKNGTASGVQGAYRGIKAAPGKVWSAAKDAPGQAWSATKAAPSKLGEKAASTGANLGNKLEESIDYAGQRRQFNKDVKSRAAEIKEEREQQAKAARERNRAIPKRFRE